MLKSIDEEVLKAAQAIPYPAELYRFDAVAEGLWGGFAAVTDEHVQRFHEQGYLVVHDAFSPDEVQETSEGLLYLMDGEHPDFRGVQFEPKVVKHKSAFSAEERRDAIRKIFRFVEYEPRLKAMSEHAGLLAVAQRLIGEKPTLFQDMALIKPPMIGSEKPWHQDCAYFNLPLETTVVAAWIALDEATPDNGCMHIIPGSHREGPMVHFKRRDWQICDTHVPVHRDVMVPLKPGGCLFWHGLLYHGTPANRSNLRRRALQFHYSPESSESLTTGERMEIFGSEGKDVDC
ncbi:MAG: phytanoyl-CoA dioxygenase family protein [Candidatus Poribacteria bacterium]|nr:phytanoyl-CoA dioxygenase family protein [Candidatus Poribacteria bacterium]